MSEEPKNNVSNEPENGGSGKPLEGEVISAPEPEPIPPPPPGSGEDPDFLEEKEGFGVQFDEFLHELNLSRRHIFYGLGCFGLIAVLIFGGIRGFQWYRQRGAQEAPQTEVKEEQEDKELKTAEPEEEKPQESVVENGIQEAVFVGRVIAPSPEVFAATGIMTSVSLGSPRIADSPLAGYIVHFRRLQNAYGTDIKASLDAAVDRRARLRGHIALLQSLYDAGVKNLAALREEMTLIESVYTGKELLQREADENFFIELRALNPETSERLLSQFISAGQEVLALRARFKALREIADMYTTALPRVERRIRDIELNEEALVTGVKVYDVRGSDLDLIIPVNNGDETTNGAASPAAPLSSGQTVPPTGVSPTPGTSSYMIAPDRLSSPVPFLPVHPSDLKTGGRDFISEPGGGFR